MLIKNDRIKQKRNILSLIFFCFPFFSERNDSQSQWKTQTQFVSILSACSLSPIIMYNVSHIFGKKSLKKIYTEIIYLLTFSFSNQTAQSTYRKSSQENMNYKCKLYGKCVYGL